jgi:oligoendopeptidase F
MRTIFSAVILVLVVFAVAGQSKMYNASTVHDQLDRKENALEQLYAKYWQIQYQLEQGDTSVSDKDVQREIRNVINDAAFLAELKGTSFNDRVLQRRRELFLQAATDSQISTDPDLATLVEAIRKDGSAMRYQVDGRLLDRAELDNTLEQQPDRQTRRNAWYAEAELTKLTGSRISQAIKLRNGLGQRYAGESFTDFMLNRRATDRASLAHWYEQIRTSTEPAFQDLLSQIKRELQVEKVEPWDFEYYFSTFTRGLEQKLGWAGGWERTEKVASLLGFDFKHLPVDVKITDITFGGYTMPIWYGKEIKMLVSKHTGVRFSDTILHESGHALHFTLVQEPTFILRDNYPPPMDEGLGQTMSLMLFRPEIATTIYSLTADQARSLTERRRLESNYALRLLMTDSEFELEAYHNPDQDLTALYDRICSKYLDVDCRHANTWGYDPFYAAIPMYQQNYVLAEMFAYQVHHTLAQKFGDKWGPEAGSYLRDKFFARGGTLTLDEIMEAGTGEKLSASYLIRALTAQPSAAEKLGGDGY